MTIEHEVTTGNIFEALNVSNPKEKEVRAKLGIEVLKILQEKNLKQREISEILGISQPEVSRLLNCNFVRFTIDKLLGFLDRLDCDFKIEVTAGKSETFYEVYSSL
jgi:predicted XRE-type DNA-binding protein